MNPNYKGFFVIALTIAIFSCNTPASNNNGAQNNNILTITTKTYKTNGGWGYAVYLNNKIYINQNIIPVVEGNKAFANQEDAKKVAALVVNKIKLHEKPILRLSDLQEAGIVSK